MVSNERKADEIAAELGAIARTGTVLSGTIRARRTRCGQSNYGCHADSPRLHGPYFQWTPKFANNTEDRWLSPDQGEEYAARMENDRRLHALLARLEALGAQALGGDDRNPGPS